MGVYASTTAMSLLLPGWFTGNTSSSDAEGLKIIEHHINRAESHVHSALGNRYSLPFSPVPPAIRTMVEDISVYYALRAGGSRQGQLNEYVEEYKRAFENLNKIAEGDMVLVNTDGSIVSVLASNRMLSNTVGHELILNIDDPKKWRPTKAEDDDVADTRGI